MILIFHVNVSLVESPFTSPKRQASVTSKTYQRMLSLEENLGANRMVLESISSVKRQCITNVTHEDNLLGSLMGLHGYIDNTSIHSTHSVDLLDADFTSVRTATCD